MKNYCLKLQNPHACPLVFILSIRFSYKVILWTWPFTNDHVSRSWSRSWHFLGSSVTILWHIPSHELREKLWVGQCQKPLCIVTLTFDQWPWIKVVTLPWLQSNNSVKYYSIHAFSKNLWPRQCLNHCEHSDLDFWPITLNQEHDTSLGLGQQSCEILFKFIKRVGNYSPVKLFAYVLTIQSLLSVKTYGPDNV
jgi:hypothetical protein